MAMKEIRHAIYIPADISKEAQLIPCGEDGTLPLETLQALVGGYIETIPTLGSANAVLIINEEGRLQKLPFNPVASALPPHCVSPIVGDAVLMRAEGDQLIGWWRCSAETLIKLCSDIWVIARRIWEGKPKNTASHTEA